MLEDVPTNCIESQLQINDSFFVTENMAYQYGCEPGVYSIRYRFRDYFGYGEWSTQINATVKPHIDPSLIADESVTIKKLSADAQKAIEEGGLSTVNIAVKGLLGEGSALVLKPDGTYALVASNGKELTGLFVNQNGTMTLDGKYIHITGDTVFDRNVITKGMIQAGAISADKIDISNGSTGARIEVTDNLITIYDGYNRKRIRLGVW